MIKGFLQIVLFALLGRLCPAASTLDVYPAQGAPLHKAIALASAGDVVLVHEGFYSEGTIVVNKAIDLRAKGKVVLDGGDTCEILIIRSNNVRISGFTLSHTGVSFIYERAGVRLDGVAHCIVQDNQILNTCYGVYSAKSRQCIIRNNVIRSNAYAESASGNGIHCWYCDSYTIDHNTINQLRDGIYLEFTSNTTVVNNESMNNIRYGLHFMFSHHNRYEKNLFHNNGSGVAVMYSHDIEMRSNVFEANLGDASYGLLLKEISHGTICYNVFRNNTAGLFAESGGSLRIHHNSFVSNGWAMRLMASSIDNTIDSNNFQSNSFDVATNNYSTHSTLRSNYWDNYTGYDLDRNGVGDVPYRPVKLFSTIVEQNSPAMLLMHSFFVSLLDLAEAIFPTVTPAGMQDDAPSMKPLRTTP